MKRRVIRLALIGENVQRSFSPKIHKFIFDKFGIDCEYELVSVEERNFHDAVTRLTGDFDGFNVTIPYKRDIMEYLDEISSDAFAIGSVNTVVCNGKKGYNTDLVGLACSLKLAGVELKAKRVLIVGAGGAGRSVAKLFKDGGANVWAYRRDKEKLKDFNTACRLLPIKLGGDDRSFNELGVPTLWYGSNNIVFQDFHTPCDTISTLSIPCFKFIAEDALQLLEALCN